MDIAERAPHAPEQTPPLAGRPSAHGKFLSIAESKLYVRGVTYGTFAPDPDWGDYPAPEQVAADFEAMAASGINALRTYTVPPVWLLDLAAANGLRIMVGLAWEQHVTFLDDPARVRSIERRVREGVAGCAGHPAVLCYAIGNEIPAPIVRWHGPRRTERFLARLAEAARSEDPDGLVTYVNFPSTEYLQLPFLDVVSFNVYLETRARLDAYLASLQTLAGDRPLLLAEIGLDSRRNGLGVQADLVSTQIEAAFEQGCAGAFVFSWTDEWHRGGFEIDDWDFGLTDRQRRPKPALASATEAFAHGPFPPGQDWPSVSVVMCTHNGSRTIRESLEGVLALDYPDYEVIVVDDGSTDGSGSIAARFPVQVIHTRNMGLSSARNTGLDAASGQIVAFVDDDARPDPQWLRYLALTFARTGHAGVGGPNIAPPDDGVVAECVARAPGGPIHVLLSDQEAEHIPGCNMAFRAEELRAVGGFDSVFRAAGDDVDVCWTLQQSGLTLGFNPAAAVWHRRRSSVRGYLRQQRGYGRAEALLERKWPQKYNGLGHVTWAGRLYGNGSRRPLGRRSRVHYGLWGSGLFQRLYHPPQTSLHSLPLMPEWPLLLGVLAAVAALGVLWAPLFFATVPAAALVVFVLVEAAVSAARAPFPARGRPRRTRLRQRLLLACLNLCQPIARLSGRLGYGLTPWRMRGQKEWAVPRPRSLEVWNERWASSNDRLSILEEGLRGDGVLIGPGGVFDRWDLEARGGMLGAARLRMTIEEHGAGRQLLRFRITPRPTRSAVIAACVSGAVAASAALHDAWTAAAVVAAVGAVVLLRALAEASLSTAALLRGVTRQRQLAEFELQADLIRRLEDETERTRAEAPA
jgi:GT2 family glycosyltransferase